MKNHFRKIGVDIDGILLDFFGPFIRFYNSRNGTKFTVDHITSYNLCKALGISQEQLDKELGAFYISSAFKHLPVIEGSKEALTQAKKTNLLYNVTSRPNETRTQTVLSIYSNFPGLFSGIHITNGYGGNGTKKEKKSDICVSYGYELIIEDSAKEANDCAKRGIEAILMAKPWNAQEETVTGVTRVKNWEEALQYLT